jgi:hypothetical protein
MCKCALPPRGLLRACPSPSCGVSPLTDVVGGNVGKYLGAYFMAVSGEGGVRGDCGQQRHSSGCLAGRAAEGRPHS